MFTYVISDKIDFQYDQPAYYMLHINENNAMNLQTSRSPSSGWKSLIEVNGCKKNIILHHTEKQFWFNIQFE